MNSTMIFGGFAGTFVRTGSPGLTCYISVYLVLDILLMGSGPAYSA